MSGVPEIEILLATYNGARFLREQIDSLLAQDYANLRVLARDDGSSDETAAILGEYARDTRDRFRLLPAGTATGSAKGNFLLLMQASRADYVCFCDQDDVWLPNKISKTKQAMDQLELHWGSSMPLLAFTDMRLVDEHLGMLAESFWSYMEIDPERIHRPATLMVQSVVTGCTAMVNRPLLNLAVRMPEAAYMHDRWVGLLASFFGRSCAVRSQTMLYRQHERNLVGTGRGPEGTTVAQRSRPWWQRFLRPRMDAGIIEPWNRSQRDAIAFLKEYSDALPAAKRTLLEAFLRCQHSSRRRVRVFTFLRYRFFYAELKMNYAILVHLWTRLY